MKHFLLLIFSVFLCGVSSYGQQETVLAQKIAHKLKDSLLLSGTQQEQLFTINMQLHQQKMEMRRQHSGSDSLGYYIQRVENTRDSLYKAVIPQEKYLLYLQKKKAIVNNN